MKKIRLIVLILLIFLFLLGNSFADTVKWGTAPAEKVITGIGNVASSIVSDSFSPLTHYKKDDFMVSITPAYFQVEKAYDSPEITSDDMNGFSLGFGAGYAITDDILLYGIFAGMDVDGKLTAKIDEGGIFSSIVGNATINADFQFYSLYFGAGYDFFPNESKWSIILFGGISFQQYMVDANYSYTTPTGTPVLEYNIDAKISGSDQLYGATMSLVASREIFDLVRISPYFLYNRSINKPTITLDMVETETAPTSGTRKEIRDVDLENVSLSMFGLDVSVLASDNLSFALSIGGFITSSTSVYNDTFLNGLSMNSLVFTVTYLN